MDVKNKTYGVSFMYGIRPLVRSIHTHYGTVQFVLSSHFASVKDVIATFDLTCCRIASIASGEYIEMDRFSTQEFWEIVCSSSDAHNAGGEGNLNDVRVLTARHRHRSLQRAQKYRKRGLAYRGTLWGGPEILTFSMLYKKTNCYKYENRLDEPSLEGLRSDCTCLHHVKCELQYDSPYVFCTNGGNIQSSSI